GISPRASHRTGLDTLASSGSCHSPKTAVFRRNPWAPSVSRWPVDLSASDPPPSLHPHYRDFTTTTRQSAPNRCIGISALWFCHLCLFPYSPAGDLGDNHVAESR